MTDTREDLFEQIRRMSDEEVAELKEYIDRFPTPAHAAFRNAPYDDEPFTEEDERLVNESIEWDKEHGDDRIPHKQIMREYGLE